ncbi:ABC transporter permease [Pseudoalteromonas umbrosa]|uniref:ABC transporter permease n=1 Tax=Pseudoalteromonas umbrosa TaxID=3048489 RepID=UPI0024C2A734|nr:FtsX-like permease family protein [Pseudoalteromonas sp. B95]MDK1287346.1 ABC transporter permease [Pseudoalteromonas sp. B95]
MKDFSPIFKTLWKNKTGPMLLILQIAVAFTILTNVSFMASSKLHDLTAPSGLDEDVLFSFRANLPVESSDYVALLDQDLRDIKELNSVERITVTNSVPLAGWGVFYLLTENEDPESYIASAGAYSGSREYMDTLGFEIIMGRWFEESEIAYASDSFDDLSNSILVTKELAKRISPNDWSAAVGSTVYIHARAYQIVGIIDRLIATWPEWHGNERSVVFPAYIFTGENRFIVRAKPGQLEQAMDDVKSLLMQQPGRFVTDLNTFKHTRETGYKSMESSFIILTSVTIALIMLTMLGVFGQARFTLMKRRRQIGTRRALGASKFQIMRFYILENLIVVGIGVILGCLCAVIANVKLIELFRQDAVPYEYFLYGGLSVFVASLIAVIPTAYNAANTSPAIATRSV